MTTHALLLTELLTQTNTDPINVKIELYRETNTNMCECTAMVNMKLGKFQYFTWRNMHPNKIHMLKEIVFKLLSVKVLLGLLWRK